MLQRVLFLPQRSAFISVILCVLKSTKCVAKLLGKADCGEKMIAWMLSLMACNETLDIQNVL